MTTKFVALGLFSIAVATALLYRPTPQLEQLAKHVLAEGNEVPLPVEIATFFHIPHDGQPLTFRMVKAGSRDGRLHSIAARARPETEYVDILLSDTTKGDHGYHYRTGTHGRCIKAAYVDTEMRPVPDAAARFDAEIKNWLEYMDNVEGNPGKPLN